MTRIILPGMKPAFLASGFHDGEKCGELMEGKRELEGEETRKGGSGKNFVHDLDVGWQSRSREKKEGE